MTKRDFEFIAQTILYMNLSLRSREEVADAFATDLAVEYPGFDRVRFLAACGCENA